MGFALNRTQKRFATGASFQPETIAYLNALPIVNNATQYFVSTPQQITGAAIWNAMDSFVVTIKNTFNLTLGLNNLSSIFPAIYPFIGDTAIMQKWNLSDAQNTDAAYRLIFNGGITHTSTGANPNGLNGFANTFFNVRTYRGSISTLYDQFSIGYYSRENNIANEGLMGCSDGVTSTRMLPNAFSNDYSQINSGLSSAIASARVDKLILTTRNGSSGGNSSCIRYRNGVQYATTSVPTTSLQNTNQEIYLFGQKNAANALEYPTTNECAFAFISNIGMSSTIVTDVTNAVNTLQTTLLRQV
jgi:hypothetical protein